MAIELHHLNTHGMMEQAGNVLDGVARLKQRIAELEEELARKCPGRLEICERTRDRINKIFKSTPRTPVRVDFGKFKEYDELEKLIEPVKPAGKELASRFEHDMFLMMKENHLCKVYAWTELNASSFSICIGKERPEGESCTEHDFTNFLEMSDEEFDAFVRNIPKSPNEDVVREWREEMKRFKEKQ